MGSQKRSIYLVTAETHYILASTFLRFQEYYEGIEFHKKIFSVEECMDWYAKKYGGFSYFDDYAGFNVPSWVFAPFYQGKFDPLLEKEKTLLKLLRNIKGEFYVIGASRENEGTKEAALKHEFVHGLYYTVPQYGDAVAQFLEKENMSIIHRALAADAYHPSVFTDEANAYLLTGLRGLDVGKMSRKKIRRIRTNLRAIFHEHIGYSIDSVDNDMIMNTIHHLRLPEHGK